jgi:hypothetical protein
MLLIRLLGIVGANREVWLQDAYRAYASRKLVTLMLANRPCERGEG